MADIGSTLRESRMRARIDISEVEVGTKIRAKYLRALENEEWDLLPGPVYVKSFLKTYGDFLGLDSRLLVDEYKRRYERPSDHEVRAMATTTRERDRSRSRSRSRSPSRIGAALLTPRTVIILALIVIVAALYVIGNHSGKGPSNSGNAIAPATNTKGSGHHHHHGRTGTHSSTGTTTNTVGTKTVTTPVIPKRASLKLVATSTVWVCVENQAGKPLMSPGDVTVGQTLPTFHAKQILLALGNSGVTMTADGKPYTPAGGAPIGLKITATGVKPLSPAPTCAA
jgi:cytoskeleton protein RodZ